MLSPIPLTLILLSATPDLTSGASGDQQVTAAVALGASDPDAAVDLLSGLLTGPQAPAAIDALGKLATPRAIALLRPLLDLPDLEAPALTALANSDAGERVLIQRRMATILPGAERDALDAVLAAQPRTPELLATLLTEPNELLALAAAARLADQPAGIAVLVHCLETLSAAAQRCATGLAGSTAAASEVPRLLQSRDSKVRALMVSGFVSTLRMPASELLAPLVTDPDEEVRAALTFALARLGANGVAPLSVLLRDPQLSVRQAAATQLATLLPADRLHLLALEAIHDPSLRSAIVPATARLAPEDAIRLLKTDLGEADARERRRDLTLLAHFREPEAVNALMDSATKDPDPGLREYAVELLAQ